MAALLTVFNKHPAESFLVVGCDYPFVGETDLHQLIKSRNEIDIATGFFNKITGFYEPMLSIYENRISGILFDNFNSQQYSLQHVLRNIEASKVDPLDLKTIKSIDTAAEYADALNCLNQGKGI